MISAIAWLPLGVAAENPQKAEAPDDELAEVAARVESKGGMGAMRRVMDNSDDDSEDEWEEMGSDELAEIDQEDQSDDDEAEEEDDPDAGKKAAKRAAAVAAAAHSGAGIDAAMAELDMDKYDDDDDADVNAARLFGGGRSAFHDSNADDPYMTINDEQDEMPRTIGDFTMLTDLVLLAARTDDDVSHLEVYVYKTRPQRFGRV